MAAAILMMNMQGAVMAADKDQTIFRYSDKVPFALMTDPTSNLPWADIWNEFRVNSDLSDAYVSEFMNYLMDALPRYADSISREVVFFFFYEIGSIFPISQNLIIQMDHQQVEISIDESSMCISPRGTTSDVNWLGNLSHMGTVLGDSIVETVDVAREIYPQLVSDFKTRAVNATKEGIPKTETERYIDDNEMGIHLACILDATEFRFRNNLIAAINSYHIEDMVRMSESLIDVEAQLQHLQEPSKPLMATKEIATMTLAEGFSWIKHSLYGA